MVKYFWELVVTFALSSLLRFQLGYQIKFKLIYNQIWTFIMSLNVSHMCGDILFSIKIQIHIDPKEGFQLANDVHL